MGPIVFLSHSPAVLSSSGSQWVAVRTMAKESATIRFSGMLWNGVDTGCMAGASMLPFRRNNNSQTLE